MSTMRQKRMDIITLYVRRMNTTPAVVVSSGMMIAQERYFVKRSGYREETVLFDLLDACDFKNVFKIAKKYHAEAVSYDFTKSENLRDTQVTTSIRFF